MLGYLGRAIVVTIAVFAVLATAAFADDRPADQTIQEEVWAIPVTLPTIAYVVRPVGKGPFPLVVMNHGVSMNQRERGFFPLVEFRDAAMWFADGATWSLRPPAPDTAQPHSMTRNADCTPCSFQRSAVATIRTSATPDARWP